MRQWGLADHAAAMGLFLEPATIDRLQAFLQMLDKWNRVYNLTALADEETWVSHHLLDSLSIVKILPPGRLIDVGSGGGFPGVPIALANPQRQVVLLDSSAKKTAFLRQAVVELELANVTVQTGRVERFQPDVAFDVVTCRAFSDLATFIRLAGHLCKGDGRLVAMKGVYPAAELAQLPQSSVDKVVPLAVPSLDQQRHAVVLYSPAANEA